MFIHSFNNKLVFLKLFFHICLPCLSLMPWINVFFNIFLLLDRNYTLAVGYSFFPISPGVLNLYLPKSFPLFRTGHSVRMRSQHVMYVSVSCQFSASHTAARESCTICTSMIACSAFCFSLGLCLLFSTCITYHLTSFSVLSITLCSPYLWPADVSRFLCALSAPPLVELHLLSLHSSLSSLLFGGFLFPQHFQSLSALSVCSSLLFSFQY